MKATRLLIVVLVVLGMIACTGKVGTPKPMGYFRVDMPEHAYQKQAIGACPFSAEVSKWARIETTRPPYGFDYYYPLFDARVHCDYKPVEDNLRALVDDAHQSVYHHAGMASSIPDSLIWMPEREVYGVFFLLRGNTASPCQFFVTDSVSNFVRGSLYFNCLPNQDSLAPMAEYIADDIRRMIATIEWDKQ